MDEQRMIEESIMLSMMETPSGPSTALPEDNSGLSEFERTYKEMYEALDLIELESRAEEATV